MANDVIIKIIMTLINIIEYITWLIIILIMTIIHNLIFK